MKARFTLLACGTALALSCLPVAGQTTNAAPAVKKPAVVDVPQPEQPAATSASAAPTTDPAKIAEYQKRFAHGKDLEQQGKPDEALTVFEGIIAEAPDAKGSLLEAGYLSFQMGKLDKAADYFERLHTLVPDYPAAIESLIQINQAMKRDVKVAILIKQYRTLFTAGKVPKPYFVRERVAMPPGSDQLVFTEFFSYLDEPYTVWMAELFDTSGTRKRWFLLNYEPDATQALRAKEPKLAQAEVFNLYEYVLTGDKPTQVNLYKNYIGIPDYNKTRMDILGVIATAPAPLYSSPVPTK